MTQSNIAIQIDEKQTAELKNTEWKIIALVGSEISNKEIAAKLCLSEGTVRNSLSTILSKLELRDRAQLAISVNEVRQIKEIMESVKRELDEHGVPYGDVEQGIMIETPAAVMISDQLAEEVDFFSIGTNDLTQYTLAIDRQNMKLDNIYDSHHPAVLHMIQMTIDNGHKHGCWVGICGELDADLTLTKTFIEMGN